MCSVLFAPCSLACPSPSLPSLPQLHCPLPLSKTHRHTRAGKHWCARSSSKLSSHSQQYRRKHKQRSIHLLSRVQSEVHVAIEARMCLCVCDGVMVVVAALWWTPLSHLFRPLYSALLFTPFASPLSPGQGKDTLVFHRQFRSSIHASGPIGGDRSSDGKERWARVPSMNEPVGVQAGVCTSVHYAVFAALRTCRSPPKPFL